VKMTAARLLFAKTHYPTEESGYMYSHSDFLGKRTVEIINKAKFKANKETVYENY